MSVDDSSTHRGRIRRKSGLDPIRRAAMLNPNEGPRGGLVIWLMAVIVTCLAPAMHPIAADIAVLSITAYAMTTHSRQ